MLERFLSDSTNMATTFSSWSILSRMGLETPSKILSGLDFREFYDSFQLKFHQIDPELMAALRLASPKAQAMN